MSALLGVYGLSCRYGEQPALDEVSFELDRGRVTALIGPNGCGKSTLLKVASGIIHSARVEGQIRYLGTDSRELTQLERARQVCYVGADLAADFPLTALETVLISRISQESAVEDRVRAAMEECRCWELRLRKLHELSGGERQRVQLAKAFAQGAGVLLLDEALSRMDLDHQAAIGRALRDRAGRGQAIVIVSHDLNLSSEWADDGLLMKRGRKIASGPIGAVLSEANLRELYPGVELIIARSPGSGAPKLFFGATRS